MSSDVYAVCWTCIKEDFQVIGVYTSLEAAIGKIMALARNCDNIIMKNNCEAFATTVGGEEHLYYIDKTILYT